MTVSYNRELGVWNVDGRGAYATEAEARAADETKAQTLVVDDDDFAGSFGQAPRVLAPERTTSTVITPKQAKKAQEDFERSNELYQQGYSDLNGDGTINDADVRLSGTAFGTPTSAGGTATHYQTEQEPIGTRNMRTGRMNGPVMSTTTVAPGVGGGAPGTQATQRDQNAAAATEAAGAQFQNHAAENAAENDNLFADAMKRFDDLEGPNNQLSDEAREYQKEGLAQQRMLLEELLGFDPNQYATEFADQALARQIALGRAAGTSAAAQQAGIFAAQEQAPALYAEGRRQADALENQRLSLAESAAKSFGELGTMTRGQDETRAQFEAQLPLEIANSVATLTQGKMNLNQQESQMFAEIWMDFARLQSVYAGMSSAEQMAWWENETARRGQDKQFEAIKAQIKANGAVSDKDILNGIFQLGGGLLGLGGGLGAA